MIKIVKKIIKYLLRCLRQFPSTVKQASATSYYPEMKRKNYAKRLFENLLWLIKYNEANEFYNLYGFDICDFCNQEEYKDYYNFMLERNIKHKFGSVFSQLILLRNKLIFYKYMSSNMMNVPEVFAFIKDGVLFDINFNRLDFDSLKNENDYFIKDVDGECASYVKHIDDYEHLKRLKNDFNKGEFIFQRKIIQCQEMNKINPLAINTLRIVTVNKDGNPYLFSSVLRIGTQATGNVDNWAAGGLAVGIDEKGYLKQHAFYKPMFGQKTDIHPDSNIIFKDFQVPQYELAVKMACEAHKHFYGIRTIGWDITITDKGPYFIEGNDNWAISLMQVCDHGLKQKWIEAMKD